MSVLVIGSGTLGAELEFVLRQHGEKVTVLRRNELDIRDTGVVDRAIRKLRVDTGVGTPLCFNAAAYTNVNGAENEGAAEAIATNVDGALAVAEACDRLNVLGVYFSSDAVYRNACGQTECDEPVAQPAGMYGASKLLGERAVRQFPQQYVLRIANLYGSHGRNWASRLRQTLTSGERVFADAERTVAPTWARWVAEVAVRLVVRAPPAVYHVCPTQPRTWHAFARSMALGLGVGGDEILPAPPAPRPLGQSGYLSSILLPAYGIEVPTWEDLLIRYLTEDTAS